MNGQATKYHLFDLPMQNQDPIFSSRQYGGGCEIKGVVGQRRQCVTAGETAGDRREYESSAKCTRRRDWDNWDSFLLRLLSFFYRKWGESRGHFSKSPNGHVSNVSKEVFLQKVEMSSGPYLMLLEEVLCSFTSEASLISPCPQGHSGTTTNSYWQKIFRFATSDNRNSNDHLEANIESEDVFVEIHYVDYSHFREQVPFKHLHCTE